MRRLLRTKTALWEIAVVVLTCVGGGWAQSPTTTPSVAQTRPARPASYMVGMPVPVINETTFDGKPVAIRGASDKVHLLLFYVSWCPYCRQILPGIEALHQKYKDKGVEVVAINMDTRSGRRARTEQQVLDHYRELKLSMPMVIDAKQVVGPRFRVTSYPTSVLVGRNGIIESVHFGATVAFDSTLSNELDLLLAGKDRQSFPAAAAPPTPSANPPTPATQPAAPRRPAMELEGKPAPAAAGESIDGKEVRVGAGSGRVQLLAFYASWCGFCRRAMPTVERLYQDYKDKGVDVVAINQDERSGPRARTEEQTLDTYREWNLSMPMTMDPDQAVGRAYNVSGYPTFFLIGRDGTVEAVHVGAPSSFDSTVRTQLDLLLAGKDRKAFPAAPTQPAASPNPVTDLAGKPAPSASARTFDGKDLRIGPGGGRLQLVAFYASWCGFCKRAMPFVEQIHKDYRDKGLEVIAVNVDSREGRGAMTQEQTLSTYREWNLSMPMTLDPEQKIARQFRVTGYPTFFLINGSGTVEAVYVGGGEVSGGQARAKIDSLLKSGPAAG